MAAFPLLRPWGDKTGGAPEMIEAFASPMWVVAHMSGMAGFVLIAAAVLAWGRRRARGPGVAQWWIAGGVALILPFFGAETFGLHVVAATAPQDIAIATAAGIREGLPQLTAFGLGLLAIAAGAVLLALRDRAAVVLAIGLATYLPQFFFGPEIRIAHGVVLLAGAVCWAWSSWPGPRGERGPAARG
ncbi:hypothetical protein ACFWGD_10950 [Corynebacterium sp. NPDC060344]|uniref:hypothetical protein n=1 Tax=Corynebacterium sp. NPDC060344 TaxID=3347101 RepID=UPI00365297B6